MSNAGPIVEVFYAAVQRKDIAAARRYLHADLTFHGLFETHPDADAYLAALTGLLSITSRLDVKALIGEGDDAAIFFELETSAPAAATTLVAEWHRVRDGRTLQVHSAFDGRPFEAMFAPARRS